MRGNKLLYILYQPYKWFILFPIMFVDTLFFGTLAVIISPIIGARVGGLICGSFWSKINTVLTPMIVKTIGKENIQKGTSYIVVANHQSLYDIFLVYGWIGLDIRWIMKKELAKVPGVGYGSKSVGHIFIDRSNQRAALKSLEEAKKKLVNGTSVVIFPEGTRSKTGKLIPFKRGAFKLAKDLSLPILPVTINGTRKIMPHPSIVNILPGVVKMTIHKPITINGITEKDVTELMNKTKAIIESGIED
jgi:1-acyl-sn-glycerol-3-phosphate acyltransferase